MLLDGPSQRISQRVNIAAQRRILLSTLILFGHKGAPIMGVSQCNQETACPPPAGMSAGGQVVYYAVNVLIKSRRAATWSSTMESCTLSCFICSIACKSKGAFAPFIAGNKVYMHTT